MNFAEVCLSVWVISFFLVIAWKIFIAVIRKKANSQSYAVDYTNTESGSDTRNGRDADPTYRN